MYSDRYSHSLQVNLISSKTITNELLRFSLQQTGESKLIGENNKATTDGLPCATPSASAKDITKFVSQTQLQREHFCSPFQIGEAMKG